jgi:hypothetical protein
VLISRRIAALIVAAALGAPASAAAQTTTTPRGKADVSNTPPVPLPDGSSGNGAGQATATGDELPNTGSDPRVLFLCGVALTLLGVGLRLRTADAELY